VGVNQFYGATYLFDTALNGPQRIGVAELLMGWSVVWWSNTGQPRRVKSGRLPVVDSDPEYVQARLDKWAGDVGLTVYGTPVALIKDRNHGPALKGYARGGL
jgi:hypothetical protein